MVVVEENNWFAVRVFCSLFIHCIPCDFSPASLFPPCWPVVHAGVFGTSEPRMLRGAEWGEGAAE